MTVLLGYILHQFITMIKITNYILLVNSSSSVFNLLEFTVYNDDKDHKLHSTSLFVIISVQPIKIYTSLLQ